ncbi:MAG: phospholipase A2 [Actinomycetota bacterium]|nr:phospholipase A2 [Actinomycetota bacterium]
MRLRFALLVAVTSVLTVLSPATAGPVHAAVHPAAHAVAGDWAYVQYELYSVSLGTFVAHTGTGDRWYDWSTDYCSAPLVGSTGLSFDFRAACRRHDFGYRNLKLLDRRYGAGLWNGTNRRRVDQQFLADMKSHCRGRAVWLQPSCFGWAETYYTAVRLWGGP